MPRVSRLGHVALYAKDPMHMTEFYCDLFDLKVSARDKSGKLAFLGIDPRTNHHDLAFVSRPGAAHISFYVASLAEFRAFHAALKARGIAVLNCQMVMLGLRMDFHDPEGNVAEVNWLHGRWGRFPFFRQVDLDTMSDADILRIVEDIPLEEEVVRAVPSSE